MNNAEINVEPQKSGPHHKESSEELKQSLDKERISITSFLTQI